MRKYLFVFALVVIFSDSIRAQVDFNVSVQGIPDEGMVTLSYRNEGYEPADDTLRFASNGRGEFTGQIFEPHSAVIQFLDSAGKQLIYQRFFLSAAKTRITFHKLTRSTTIVGGAEQLTYSAVLVDDRAPDLSDLLGMCGNGRN